MSDSLQPHGLEPTKFLHPWDLPGKNIGVGCHYPAFLNLFNVVKVEYRAKQKN